MCFVGVCLYVCTDPGFICLALHVQGDDSCNGEGPRDKTGHGIETTCWGWRAGRGEVARSDIHLSSDSLSSLYEQKVAV